MKRMYALLLFSMLLFSNSYVSSATLTIHPTIYVDDDNTEGPWDGSPVHPYKSIQDAIDNALDGYTVYVQEGIYFEDIIITKSIDLHGENKYSTVIDAKYLNRSKTVNIVHIKATEVIFDNFTITDSNLSVYTQDFGSIYINNSQGVQISNIIILKQRAYADAGIIIKYSSDILIENNRIRSSMPASVGIGFVASSSVQIKYNRIEGDFLWGISAGPENVLIEGNVICNATMAIEVKGSSPFTNDSIQIVGNQIENNDYGVLLRNSKDVRVERNNFINNDQNAGFDTCISNIWNKNYWDGPRMLPVIIKGYIHTMPALPWINVDLHPAKTQYHI